MSKTKKRYLILILSILCVLSIYMYNKKNNDSAENVAFNDIAIIKIFSGGTGKEIEVYQKDDINKIIHNLKSIDFRKDKSSKDFFGYSFSISFYDLRGNKKDTLIINDTDTIQYNDYFYKDKNSDIDYDFIASLFDKY